MLLSTLTIADVHPYRCCCLLLQMLWSTLSGAHVHAYSYLNRYCCPRMQVMLSNVTYAVVYSFDKVST